MPKVIKYFQNLEKAQDQAIVLTMWDFAGQHLYYASHGIFLIKMAIYVLIYDLSKDLNAPCEEGSNQTNLEILLSWLACVNSVCGSDVSGKGSYLPPPVMIVGTHADSSYQKPEEMEKLIKDHLKGKEYRKHVVGYFKIENSSDCTKVVQEIQQQIHKILATESYIGIRVPVTWFHFEKVGLMFSCLFFIKYYQASITVLTTDLILLLLARGAACMWAGTLEQKVVTDLFICHHLSNRN